MSDGLAAVFDANRERLLRYFRAHGAGDSAEDLLQELWLKVSSTPTGPLGAPVNYLFRSATNLVIDRRRSDLQARARDHHWSDLADRQGDRSDGDPDPERVLLSRRTLQFVEEQLQRLSPRALRLFRRHRIDGVTQRQLADESGLSQSTIESDLRQAYRLLHDIRGRLDEE